MIPKYTQPLYLKLLFGFIGTCISLIGFLLELKNLPKKKKTEESPNNSSSSLSKPITLKSNHLNSSKTPTLLAFSFAGMLWAYYIGVIAFIRDHFNLQKSQIKLSGISAGCSAVLTIFFDLTISEAFKFGLGWQDLFDNRLFKFWFLDTREVLNMVFNVFKSMNIDDKTIILKYKKYGEKCFDFGVSAFQFIPFKLIPMSINNFNSLKEICYVATCSMRTLPFFYKPGYYNGYYCIDGGLVSRYSVTDDNKNNDIIKVSTVNFTRFNDDIHPQFNFAPKEWLTSGTLDDNLERFKIGYRDASKVFSMIKLVKKGLYWESNDERFNDEKWFNNMMKGEINEIEWSKYINERSEYWVKRVQRYFKQMNKF